MKLFLQKNAKFSSAGGSAPRPPCLRRLGALPPNPQNSPPPLRISDYAPGREDKDTFLLHTTAFPNLAFLCAEGFRTVAPNTDHNERIHWVILLHGVIEQLQRHKHQFLSAILA